MAKMKVAVFYAGEDGSGYIAVYEIDAEKFQRKLDDLSPSDDGDWWSLAHFVEEEGRLLHKIRPDYSIMLEQT
ncbi:MAG: hypothetical protein KIH04_08950 [Candidatus Freyarchaeota archaeon]|nr:hypothetical protein [Candidatus Jordarchaeia archaeon]